MDMRVAGGVGGSYSSRYGISGGGGCGYGCGLYDISMVDRMMLKFRPIAPKPVSSGYGCGESMTVNDHGKSGGARKRRYVRVKGNNKRNIDKNMSKKRKVSTTSPEIVSAGGGDHVVVTLPLMPETPDRKEKSAVINKIASPTTTWLSFTKINNHLQSTSPSSTERRRPTVSFVTVERVRKTRVDCTAGLVDWREMERDTCPRFISDGGDRVVWTNKAYREMAGGGDDEEVVVVLVRKKLDQGSWPAEFTCHVKVTWGSGVRSSNSAVTVPCDTWILKGGSGGYAWRLDVKAALSLGR